MLSVIIPTYNRCKYLSNILSSILSMKSVEIELIIIDDNSTDQTPILCSKYSNNPQIRIIRNEVNRGQGPNRHLGFKLAKGEYVTFADDDDYYTDCNFFDDAIKMLDNNPKLSFYSGSAKKYHVSEGIFENHHLPFTGMFKGSKFMRDCIFNGGKPLSTFTTVFRKSALEKSKLLEMEMVNDVAIYLRALLTGNCYISDKIVGVYRVHSNAMTHKQTGDLIVKNLDEIKWVYDQTQSTTEALHKSWMRHAFDVYCSYFHYNSKYSFHDLYLVYKWGRENKLVGINYFFKNVILRRLTRAYFLRHG